MHVYAYETFYFSMLRIFLMLYISTGVVVFPFFSFPFFFPRSSCIVRQIIRVINCKVLSTVASLGASFILFLFFYSYMMSFKLSIILNPCSNIFICDLVATHLVWFWSPNGLGRRGRQVRRFCPVPSTKRLIT